MARIHPSDIERLRVEAPHRAELHTLDALRHHLPDDYTVYHSLHFAYQQGQRQRFGEIDLLGDIRSTQVLLGLKSGGPKGSVSHCRRAHDGGLHP